MNAEEEAAVCRCGGCEKIFGREDARQGYWGAEDEWIEYGDDRCPWCGTEVTSDYTEVENVTF